MYEENRFIDTRSSRSSTPSQLVRNSIDFPSFIGVASTPGGVVWLMSASAQIACGSPSSISLMIRLIALYEMSSTSPVNLRSSKRRLSWFANAFGFSGTKPYFAHAYPPTSMFASRYTFFTPIFWYRSTDCARNFFATPCPCRAGLISIRT